MAERLQFIIEVDDKGSAVLRKVRGEVVQLQKATEEGSKGIGKLGRAAVASSVSIGGLGTALVTVPRALQRYPAATRNLITLGHGTRELIHKFKLMETGILGAAGPFGHFIVKLSGAAFALKGLGYAIEEFVPGAEKFGRVMQRVGLIVAAVIAGASLGVFAFGRLAGALGGRLLGNTTRWLNEASYMESKLFVLDRAIKVFEDSTKEAAGSSAQWAAELQVLAAGSGVLFSELQRGLAVLFESARVTELNVTQTRQLLSATADLSVALTRPFQDTLQRLVRSFEGFHEGARLIGIRLDDATVATKQLGVSVDTFKTQLTDSERVTARFNEAMAQMAGNIGLAGEAADKTLRGAMGRAQVSMQQFHTELGQGVAMVYTPAIVKMGTLAEYMRNLLPAGAVQSLGAFSAISGILLKLTHIVLMLVAALGALNLAFFVLKLDVVQRALALMFSRISAARISLAALSGTLREFLIPAFSAVARAASSFLLFLIPIAIKAAVLLGALVLLVRVFRTLNEAFRLTDRISFRLGQAWDALSDSARSLKENILGISGGIPSLNTMFDTLATTITASFVGVSSLILSTVADVLAGLATMGEEGDLLLRHFVDNFRSAEARIREIAANLYFKALQIQGGKPTVPGVPPTGPAIVSHGATAGLTDTQKKQLEALNTFIAELKRNTADLRAGLSDTDMKILNIVRRAQELGRELPAAIKPSLIEVTNLAREFVAAERAAQATAAAVERIKDANRRVVDIQKETKLLEAGFSGTGLEIEKTINELEALGESKEIIRPLVERLYELREATEESQVGFVDMFDVIQRGFSEMMEGVILGTRDIEDAFEGMKHSIVRSFINAFAEGWKAKQGFEGKFKINIAQFVDNIGGILQSGEIGNIFSGVFDVGSMAKAATGAAAGADSAAVGTGAAGGTAAFSALLTSWMPILLPAAVALGTKAQLSYLDKTTGSGRSEPNLLEKTVASFGFLGAAIGQYAKGDTTEGTKHLLIPFYPFFAPGPKRTERQRWFAGGLGGQLQDLRVPGAQRFWGDSFHAGTGRGNFIPGLSAQEQAFGAIMGGMGPGAEPKFSAELGRAARAAALDTATALRRLGITATDAVVAINKVFDHGEKQAKAYKKATQGIVEIFTRLDEPLAIRLTNELMKNGEVNTREMRRVMDSLAESMEIVNSAFASGATSMTEFRRELVQTLAAASQAKITETLVEKSGIGALFTEPAFALRRGLRRARKAASLGGADITAAEINQIVLTISDGAEASIEQMAKAWPAIQAALEAGEKMALQLQIAAGDLDGAAGSIIESLNLEAVWQRFEELISSLVELRKYLQTSLITDERVAATQRRQEAQWRELSRFMIPESYLADIGVPPGSIEIPLPWQPQGLREAFELYDLNALSADTISFIKLMIETVGEEMRDMLEEYTHARIDELRLELRYTEQLKDWYGQIQQFSRGMIDEIEIMRFGPRATQAVFERQRAEVQNLLPILASIPSGELSGRTTEELQLERESIDRVMELLPQMLQYAQQVAPGSAAYREVLSFVEDAAAQLETFGIGAEDWATTEIGRLTSALDDFVADFTAALDTFAEIAREVQIQTVQTLVESLLDKFTMIYTLPGGQPYELNLLRGIYNRLRDPTWVPGLQHGGHVQAGRSYLVGEAGPECFVSATSGFVVPNHELRGGGGPSVQVSLNLGGVSVHGVERPDEAAKAVEKALRRRTVPALVDEIKRAARA